MNSAKPKDDIRKRGTGFFSDIPIDKADKVVNMSGDTSNMMRQAGTKKTLVEKEASTPHPLLLQLS